MKFLPLLLIACAALAGGETRLGKPLALKEPIGIDKLSSKPDKYVGKVVQVKGKATDVCRAMGCWMELADPDGGKSIRLKVEDGAIVFPVEAIGKMVVAEGKLVKLGKASYQIEATGAVIE